MASLADLGENSLVEILSFLGYDLSELERLRLVAKSFLKPCDTRKAYIHRLFQEVRTLFFELHIHCCVVRKTQSLFYRPPRVPMFRL